MALQASRPDVWLSAEPLEDSNDTICQGCGKSRAQPALMFVCSQPPCPVPTRSFGALCGATR